MEIMAPSSVAEFMRSVWQRFDALGGDTDGASTPVKTGAELYGAHLTKSGLARVSDHLSLCPWLATFFDEIWRLLCRI